MSFSGNYTSVSNRSYNVLPRNYTHFETTHTSTEKTQSVVLKIFSLLSGIHTAVKSFCDRVMTLFSSKKSTEAPLEVSAYEISKHTLDLLWGLTASPLSNQSEFSYGSATSFFGFSNRI